MRATVVLLLTVATLFAAVNGGALAFAALAVAAWFTAAVQVERKRRR